ncbi:hypothetical protein BBH99_07065 [Chryseobacterium contaminans]|uniref:Uncharacterized protein n=1 Tax=Chryseobacterium contaminans TaxID=1423959 RepID=A0A1M6V8M4_9FLAO|nr:hypothetical protein [Chryseobacterium contaminans]OCA78979.1 hypothetical protein BBH99_07065 [Chryseobacterium contaminans]SHK77857.1 hypothetical protein SAMN05444407_101117 [Chryseobacterium contaminans]
MTLYKFTSEKELLEIGRTSFKEFISDIPLLFYTASIPDQIPDHGMFLINCEIEENTVNNFKILNDGELIIKTDQIPLFNVLLVDRIKIVDFFGDSEEIGKETLEVLEKEKRFSESRLKEYLETNSRDIISYDYFREVYNPSVPIGEENEEELEKLIEEEKTHAKYCEEKISKINTVEEAVDFLIYEELSEDRILDIRNESLASKLNDMGVFFGLGMYLRNVFIYPNKNEDFLKYLNIYDPGYTVNRGEFGEGIIEDLLWRTLNHYIITDESKKKIEVLRKEKYDEDLAWSNYIKERLLSYNLGEAVISEYLKLEDQMDLCVSDEDFEHCMYEQKRILEGLSGDELSVYNHLKQDYFMISRLIKKLKNKL